MVGRAERGLRASVVDVGELEPEGVRVVRVQAREDREGVGGQVVVQGLAAFVGERRNVAASSVAPWRACVRSSSATRLAFCGSEYILGYKDGCFGDSSGF